MAHRSKTARLSFLGSASVLVVATIVLCWCGCRKTEQAAEEPVTVTASDARTLEQGAKLLRNRDFDGLSQLANALPAGPVQEIVRIDVVKIHKELDKTDSFPINSNDPVEFCKKLNSPSQTPPEVAKMLLSSPSKTVRNFAIDAVMKRNIISAAGRLIEIAKTSDDPMEARAAVLVLGHLGGDEANKALHEFANSEIPYLRAPARDALGMLQDR